MINTETGEVLHDLVAPNKTVVLAKGGRGGQGNLRFKSSTHRAPRFAQPGEAGETLSLKLELKLLADVGITLVIVIVVLSVGRLSRIADALGRALFTTKR